MPRGATIKRAYIQFKADETDSGSITVRIRAEDTNNASSFPQGKNRNISKRSETSASKSWKIPAWNKRGERGSRQRTADLSSLVKEVTSRKGWDQGNAMAFIISSADKNDRRVAESYRGDRKGAATLYVEYSGGDSSSSGSGSSAPVSSGPNVGSGSADYYVSPKGNDSNPGSKSRPFKTIRKIIVRWSGPATLSSCAAAPIEATARATLATTAPFKRDGRRGAPITIMSYPGERAVIDGGDKSYQSE